MTIGTKQENHVVDRMEYFIWTSSDETTRDMAKHRKYLLKNFQQFGKRPHVFKCSQINIQVRFFHQFQKLFIMVEPFLEETIPDTKENNYLSNLGLLTKQLFEKQLINFTDIHNGVTKENRVCGCLCKGYITSNNDKVMQKFARSMMNEMFLHNPLIGISLVQIKECQVFKLGFMKTKNMVALTNACTETINLDLVKTDFPISLYLMRTVSKKSGWE